MGQQQDDRCGDNNNNKGVNTSLGERNNINKDEFDNHLE